MRIAKNISSTSMVADAWHHRSDALSSVGSFIGILGARLGFPILDPICSILICLLIIKSSVEIFFESISQLLDMACPNETRNKIISLINEDKEVIKINDIKTRIFGSKIYIDADIIIDGNITLNEANVIAERIHDKIEKQMVEVKHCNIHILPN